MKQFIRLLIWLSLIVVLNNNKATARKYTKPSGKIMQPGLLFNGRFVTSFAGTEVSLQLINSNGIVMGSSAEDWQVLKGKALHGKLIGTIIKQLIPVQFEARYINDKLLFHFNEADVALVSLWMNITGNANNRFPAKLLFTPVTNNANNVTKINAVTERINPQLRGTWVYRKCMPGIIDNVGEKSTEAMTITSNGKLITEGSNPKPGFAKNITTVVSISSKNNTVYVNNNGSDIPVFTFTMYGSKMVTVIIASGKKQCWIKK